MTDSPAADASRLRHDLRTAVNHILGYAELLQEEAEDRADPASSAELRTILHSGHDLLETIARSIPVGDAPPDLGALRATVGAPLTRITSACDALAGRTEGLGGDAARRDLDRIRAAASRLDALAFAPAEPHPAA